MYPKANAKPVSITSGKRPSKDRTDKVQDAPFSWSWRGAEFARISPGIYDAGCVSWKGPDYVPAYARYSLRVNFRLIAEPVELALFFNFGKPPLRVPGPLSKYFQSWTMVNGELPRREQSLSPDVFMDPSLLYRVEVEDAAIDAKKVEKPEYAIYSRVRRIVDVCRP